MNNEIVPKKRIIRLKHLLFGIIILLSGIFIGFISGAYTVGMHSEFFRPTPKEVTNSITGKIVSDFPCLQGKEDELHSLIHNEFAKFGRLSEEVSYRILQMQHDIAVDIADIMPNDADKSRWMETFPQYFPGHKHRLPHARKFEERQKCGNGKGNDCMLEDWDRPPPPPGL